MAADVAGAAGDEDSRTCLAPDREVGEALLLHLLGLVDVAAVEDHRRCISFCIRAKSGSRNSCHSVTMASASAPFSAS